MLLDDILVIILLLLDDILEMFDAVMFVFFFSNEFSTTFVTFYDLHRTRLQVRLRIFSLVNLAARFRAFDIDIRAFIFVRLLLTSFQPSFAVFAFDWKFFAYISLVLFYISFWHLFLAMYTLYAGILANAIVLFGITL